MGWIISLSGDEMDLNELSKSLNTDDLSIYKLDGTYYLKSNKIIKGSNEYNEIDKIVCELVELVNGTAKLALGTKNVINNYDIYYQKEDGSELVFASANITCTARLRINLQVVNADGTVETCNPADLVPNWLDLCNKDELIYKVFKLISHDTESWVGLYKIYEVISKDLINDFHFSVPKENLRRFTQTANSYKAVGMEARHALDYEPTSIPMKITEARALIYLMVNEWIRAKG